MAAFQDNIYMNPFILDSAYMRMAMDSNCFSQFYPPETQPVTAMALESDQNSNDTRKQSSQSSSVSVVDKLESGDQQVTQKLIIITPTPTDKKRKTRYGSCAQSKKQSIGEGKVQKPKALAEKKRADQEPPTGYIHVRARRGQATDSHSLAERVRREKISERMKILQKLVPGCDKVTGKALMLDEIINYVQSLQNQVELLSMKLASLNPMFYDFGMDQDSFIFRTSETSQCSPNQQQQPTGFADTQPPATTITITNNSYNLVPTAFSHPQVHQDSASLLWGMEEQGQKFLNQSGFNYNLCSFN